MSDKNSVSGKILKGIGKFFLVLITVVLMLILTLFISLKMICSDISPSAKKVFVTTLLETGQLKFLASWFVSPAEIQAIVDENSMPSFNDKVDTSKIVIDSGINSGNNKENQEQEVEKVEISGKTFFATLLIVKDPSRVSVATIFPWREKGDTLDKIVKDSGAVGGINGGIYDSTNNTGGTPYGVVISDGKILMNDPQQFNGLVLIGLTEDNILQIIDLDDKSPEDVEKLTADLKMRDAVCFPEEKSDANNHFVQLVINGVPREQNKGAGSGLNPRTAIGQRADGALLLLVTDGRGKSGHLGASAADLINIMTEYGAVNAANLDGGSSSCMYYDNEYLMDSVTFYYSNTSWRLPLAFVIK